MAKKKDKIPLSSKYTIEEGIYGASLTPLNPDLSCNTHVLASHCLDLINRGCKGVVLFGTTGEGASFSVDERLSALDKVVEEGVHPHQIIMVSGGSNIPEAVQLAKGSLQRGCAGLLIVPPSFFKNLSDEGVISYYREIIQRVASPDLRVILYHIPQFSGVPITLKIIATLRDEFPTTVIGMKESEGNLGFAKEVIQAFPGFKVFVGNELHIMEAVHAGGSGAICGLPNLYPELICSLYKQGKQTLVSNPAELLIFFAAMKGYFFVAVFKAVMEKKKGSVWHLLRPPLVPLSDAQRKEFLLRLNSKI